MIREWDSLKSLAILISKARNLAKGVKNTKSNYVLYYRKCICKKIFVTTTWNPSTLVQIPLMTEIQSFLLKKQSQVQEKKWKLS